MPNLEDHLDRFANAASVGQLVEAGTPLLKTSAASKAARSEQFARGLQKLADAQQNGSGTGQLKALAFAWRLTSVSAMRTHRSALISQLREPTPEPTERPTVLEDPDDRRNLYEALRYKNEEWVVKFLIRSMTNDRDGSLVRGAAAETLILKQSSLVDSLLALAVEFKALQLDQRDPDLGRARILINNFQALSQAIWNNPDSLIIGPEFGSAFKALVSAGSVPGPSDRDVRIEFSKAAINFYLTVARLDAGVASTAENYTFVRPLKGLFHPADWPDEMRSDLQRLSRVAAHRLVFLLSRGRPDGQLRGLILELLGSVVGARLLSEVASDDTTLSEEQIYWLSRGKVREGSATDDTAEASLLARFDREVAELMRLADTVDGTSVSVRNQFDNEADLLPEMTAGAVRRYIDRSDEIAKAGLRLARSRGLLLEGRVGEVVEFDPKLHTPSAGAVGERTVRIVSRLVQRELSGGKRIVVLKADVDKA